MTPPMIEPPDKAKELIIRYWTRTNNTILRNMLGVSNNQLWKYTNWLKAEGIIASKTAPGRTKGSTYKREARPVATERLSLYCKRCSHLEHCTVKMCF